MSDNTGDVDTNSSTKVTNVDSLPKLFKLNIDCFEELFEWLSLKDLLELRQTCKKLRKLVHYFLKEFYPSFKIGYGKVMLFDNNPNFLQQLDFNSIKCVKEIGVYTFDFPLEDMKTRLDQVQVIETLSFRIDNKFLGQLLKMCTNLKCLCVRKVYHSSLTANGNDFLLHEYPQLKLGQVVVDDWLYERHLAKKIIELKTFFELNPTIRILSISLRLLRENRSWLKESNLELEELHLQGYCVGNTFNRMCGLINELHQRGFYKRLHFYGMSTTKEETINAIMSLRGLEKLFLNENSVKVTVPPLSNLKELNFRFGNHVVDLDALAKSLPENIEWIGFRYAEFNTLLPFIRQAARLKKIVVHQLVKKDGTHFKDGIVDVTALNKERFESTDAGKIIIYLHQSVFLATKWATTITNCPLVEVKRHAAQKEKNFCPCLWWSERYFGDETWFGDE